MDLHPGAQIGSHFFVDHCTGTVVGETTIIGSHVKMYQGVGLVAKSLAAGQQLRGQKRHPRLRTGDVYARATIINGDTWWAKAARLGRTFSPQRPRLARGQEEASESGEQKSGNGAETFTFD
jgi:serine O-acetyltransferase